MKHKAILTKKFGNEEIDILKNEYDLVIVEDEEMALEEVIKKHRDAEILIPFLSDKIDKRIIDSLERLKIISNYAVGYNNIDYEYAGESGIYVTNTPDILTDATADLTMALILAVSRRIVESDKFIRSGKFSGWGADLFLGKELRGATLGIIGLGKIGLETAKRGMGFGMNVIYYSRTRKVGSEDKYNIKYKKLNDLIKESDVISLHIPFTPDVHHMFNKNTFLAMKKNSIFINAARGAIMDENALVEVLESGHLFGAGLDVFEFEPDVNDKLKTLDNVVMTPHTGSATFRARAGMGKIVIKNIGMAVNGDIPVNLIPELAYMIK